MSVDRLLHAGAVVVDLVLQVPALPVRGGDVAASAGSAAAGGGFNVMAAAARQGLPVAYAGWHGTGALGDVARAALAAEGVRLLQPPRPDVDTGLVVTLVDTGGGGERSFVTSPQALAPLSADELARVRPTPRDAVYLSGYSLVDRAGGRALAGWLPGVQGTVVLDPGPLVGEVPDDVLGAVLARTGWLTVNAEEARVMTAGEDPGRAALLLSARCAGPAHRGVVVRTGERGCVLVLPGEAPVTVPGVPVTAVDTTGAGDAHTGVLVAGLARGLAPLAALERANAAAAGAVTRRGPATCPTAAEVDALLGT